MKTRARFLWGQQKNLRQNIMEMWKFEGVFKLFVIMGTVPLGALMERFTMWATGYSYLTAENMRRFLVHPVVIVETFFVLALLCIGTLVDMAGVIHCVHMSYHGQKTTYYHTFLYALEAVGRTLRKKESRTLPLVILPMLPILGLGLVPAVYGNLLFQNFVLKQIQRHSYLLAGSIALVIALFVFFTLCMFAAPYCILYQVSTRQALRQSFSLGKRAMAKDISLFLLTEVFCYVAYAFLLGLAMGLAFLFERLVRPVSLVNPISTSMMLTITTVALILLAAWSAPAGCICITQLFYGYCDSRGTVPSLEAGDYSHYLKLSVRGKKLICFAVRALGVVCLVACGIYVFYIYKGRFNPNIEYLHQTEVTAHRGASKYYPENTMSAFRGAYEQGADWSELDIHFSKDGALFAMHDHNLYRTCGIKGNGWDFTWEELSQMDAGYRFGKAFAGEKIPLLSEVVDFAKESQIRLNIEIKPSRYEDGLEEALVLLLEEKDFIDSCVVTSQKYSAIQKVKQLNPEIATVYVMSYAYGNIDKLIDADIFSVNSSSVTSRLVSRLHNAGKQIYVWTVNRRYNIEEMIEKNVDNIITDDVKLAKKIVAEKRVSNALHEYIRWLNKWFR